MSIFASLLFVCLQAIPLCSASPTPATLDDLATNATDALAAPAANGDTWYFDVQQHKGSQITPYDIPRSKLVPFLAGEAEDAFSRTRIYGGDATVPYGIFKAERTDDSDRRKNIRVEIEGYRALGMVELLTYNTVFIFLSEIGKQMERQVKLTEGCYPTVDVMLYRKRAGEAVKKYVANAFATGSWGWYKQQTPNMTSLMNGTSQVAETSFGLETGLVETS